ncbi:MAG: peptidoglycan bridge formation glycyltransferase FemA/FemB family protein [Thermomicrobiales bacterium]
MTRTVGNSCRFPVPAPHSTPTATCQEEAPIVTSRPTQTIPANLVSDAGLWNDAVEAGNGHLLQSWEWGQFKSDFGWEAERIAVEEGDNRILAQVLFRGRMGVSMGYIPRGPVVVGNAAAIWPSFLARLDTLARRRRAIVTAIEPNQALGLTGSFRQAGLVAGPHHVQPGRTVIVPLHESPDAQLKQMHQKTRYNVRLADKRGIEIERAAVTSANIERFYALMEDTSDRNEFGIHSHAYYEGFLNAFGERATLLFAHYEGRDAATIITARFGAEAIYMYGASSTTHRAHGAAFRLQFEAMRWAWENGSTTYDLWGIPDKDPETMMSDEGEGKAAGTKGDDWRGLYRFKTGFGGTIVSYPPTLERRHVPVLPGIARRLNLIRG